MRLIDADVFKEKLLKERDAIPKTFTERYGFGVEQPNKDGDLIRGGIKKALRCMEQTPTIDAVSVVRCKDCKHGKLDAYIQEIYGNKSNNHLYHCLNGYGYNESGHFCSYGERKDDV